MKGSEGTPIQMLLLMDNDSFQIDKHEIISLCKYRFQPIKNQYATNIFTDLTKQIF